MQATDPIHSQNPLEGDGAVGRLIERIGQFGTGDNPIAGHLVRAMQAILADATRSMESRRDALSTQLMEAFRLHAHRGSFGLLYELNGGPLLAQVMRRLRRYSSRLDSLDVLQEVFVNVYRYPHRFNAAREDAFRVWSATIVRNTVLKQLRGRGLAGQLEVPFEDLSDQPETQAASPLRGAIDSESQLECAQVYITYLQLYLEFYAMLSERERMALRLVEVDRLSYREAADQVGIKLENLKMVIFRARRKIHRAMRRVFDGLPHGCRPARDPKETGDVHPRMESSPVPQEGAQ
ncbi:MAG: sigma-70 family RNA polymerase sigma factor [Planctomycetes bacterium]|nr:sigma-70 family RNA polymerase sigma factor [Planctomycetota bacterium]MCB9911308.1 sigma-70 family RNA polymerase sigma factor [Planctomycetota bacterium]HPF15195.1 sigma-70 family RNA polymerase sigma factor [Planctomycetota bacterium]HRV81480.1 sigma-70 family RNA polymerase sigma factor [Planctomycetota bacterium]